MNATKQIEYIQYAHCVKFTEGQLDRAPWSEYILREIPVVLTSWQDDDLIGWTVDSADGRFLGSGEEREDALADAAYKLMDASRHLAGQGGAFLKAMNPNS